MTVNDDGSVHLIDSILPAQEVSLIGGPSGAGKTRWLFDTILIWQEGLPILGHASHPCPWVYVASDRSLRSVKRTLKHMGIPLEKIPLLPIWGRGVSIGLVLDEIEKSKAGLAVIESFGSFVDPPASGTCVKNMLERCERFMEKTGSTIFGVVESPKMKPYERYENPRQRISGAAAWSHFSETIFLLEQANPKIQNDPYRNLYVCPRNGAAQVVDLCFDSSGHLKQAKLIDSIEHIGR